MITRSLHFVTGKGGVGKSTIAAALAMGLAARGRRVLAIELGEAGGLCRVLATRPMAPGAIAPVLATPGLAVTYIDGAAALAEYLTRRMHLGRLGRAVLAHPLYRAFVAAAPGVRELLAMGKIRDELVLQRLGDGPRWDAVVVDAGASGHALEHLRMPAAAERAFAGGRVHREAEVNAALLRDPRTAVHVVATPEALPLAEAAQVIARLRALGLPLGAVLVNQCRPPPPPDVDAALAALAARPDDGAQALARVGRRARSWAAVQERGVAALVTTAGVDVTRLPQRWFAEGAALAQALAPLVAEAAS
ncbi:MAG: P-loop NTPase [Myxococcales bacterium]|nr:P-loop NTPase [Myxococcales bacterium]